MTARLSTIDRAKSAAAHRAAAMVQDDMLVGLGTGSTAAFLVRALGERVRDGGLRMTGVATSARTEALARAEGIAMTDLGQASALDLTIDGADEVDPDLNLIKGGGGALLQEKIVAMASDRMVVIADPTKQVGTLGAFPLPVEVVRFGWQATRAMIEEVLAPLEVLGEGVALRRDGTGTFVTDCGNHILDLHLGRIDDPRSLSRDLNLIPGVVESGLFIDVCDVLVVGHGDGRVGVRDIAAGTETEDGADPGAGDNLFADLED